MKTLVGKSRFRSQLTTSASPAAAPVVEPTGERPPVENCPNDVQLSADNLQVHHASEQAAAVHKEVADEDVGSSEEVNGCPAAVGSSHSCGKHQNGGARRTDMACQTENMALLLTQQKQVKKKKEKKHVSLEAKREKKAAKTLAIVTGAFILCWLPFFIAALITPLCVECIDQKILSFFLWLGYFNSTLNPIIYTVFSPEFRQAFKKLLCGRTNPDNYRPRHLQ